MEIVLLDAAPADGGGRDDWPGLDRCGTVRRYDRTAPEQTAGRLAAAAAAITNKVAIDRAVLAACPHLRYVGITATGFNVVDLAACRERGIAVTNVPAYSTASVAQHVFALILDDAVAVADHDRAVRGGAWAACPDFTFAVRPTREVAGERLALIGHGAIGQAVARIGRAFGMTVEIVGLPWRPAAPGRVPLAAALPRATIVSLHCPLTAETAGLVDAAFLARCRDDLLLVNTGRGPLLDERAVADWLTAHPRARAAVDVLGREPPPADNPLLGHPQVRITPHLAWATVAARRRLRAAVVDNLAAWLAGADRNRLA